jgi:hypothetical protein
MTGIERILGLDEDLLRQQHPIGNRGERPEDGPEPPPDDTEPQFRGRHKIDPNAEKDGVRPEVDNPDGVNHISNGR